MGARRRRVRRDDRRLRRPRASSCRWPRCRAGSRPCSAGYDLIRSGAAGDLIVDPCPPARSRATPTPAGRSIPARAARGWTGARTAATSSAGTRVASPRWSPLARLAPGRLHGPDGHGDVRLPGRALLAHLWMSLRDPCDRRERAGPLHVRRHRRRGRRQRLRRRRHHPRRPASKPCIATSGSSGRTPRGTGNAPYFTPRLPAQVADLALAIRDGRPPAIGGEDGLRGGGDGAAARRSWESDTVVNLADFAAAGVGAR